MMLFDYLMTETKNEAYLANFTPLQLAFFHSFPAWLVVFWGGGGVILLPLLKRLAVPVLSTSLVCMVATAIHNFGISYAVEIFRTFGASFTFLIFVIAAARVVHAQAMAKRGVPTCVSSLVPSSVNLALGLRASLIAALFLLLHSAAGAAPSDCTLFVDADAGSDVNDGLSEVTAWRTINRATTDWSGAPAGPGDVVCVIASSASYDEVVYLRVSGAPSTRITLKGYPGPGGERPIITGGWACFTSEDDVPLHDLSVEGFRCETTGTGFNLTNNDVYAYEHLSIRDNVIYTTGDLGIFMEVPPPAIVKPETGPQHISFDILLEDNVVDGANGECVYIGSAVSSTGRTTEVWENPVRAVTVRGNVLSNCEEALDMKQNVSALYFYENIVETSGKVNGNAIRLDGQDAEVTHNVFRRNGSSSGWSQLIAFTEEKFSGHTIHHNTFIDTVFSSSNIGLPSRSNLSGARQFSVHNNSFIGSANSALESASESGSVLLVHDVLDNAFSSSGSAHFFGDPTVANFQACNGYDVSPAMVSWELACIADPSGLGIEPSDGALELDSALLSAASDGSNIGAWQGPQPDFSASSRSGPAPLEVAFADLSTLPIASILLGDGHEIDYSITEWLWDFGDSATSTLQHPLHTYVSEADFTVSLTVSNRDGFVTVTRPAWISVGGAPDYLLTASVAGTGHGSIASSPLGIDCNGDCTENYPVGTAVTLTATPDIDSVFSGWSGDCSGAGLCIVTLDRTRSVTATFEAETSLPCDYFVDASATTVGDGSAARPWQTISEAVVVGSPAAGGATVCVMEGTYAEDVDIDIEGSPATSLVIQAYPGDAPVIAATDYCFSVYNPDPDDTGDDGFDYVEYLTIDGLECVGARESRHGLHRSTPLHPPQHRHS